MKLTIITTTFNRCNTLHRLFDSLQMQNSSDFEWLVVDDGSCDGTSLLIESFKKKSNFKIKYLFQINSGKHVAINNALSMACGKYVLILDSDDWLLEGVVHCLYKLMNEADTYADIAGICMPVYMKNGDVIGMEFPESYSILSNTEHAYKLKIDGDKVQCYKKEILEKFSFPVFYGEKFLQEAVVWNRIARQYKKICVNEKVVVCEYQSNGLSALIGEHQRKSPLGAALYYSELVQVVPSYAQKFRILCIYYKYKVISRRYSLDKIIHLPAWLMGFVLAVKSRLND